MIIEIAQQLENEAQETKEAHNSEEARKAKKDELARQAKEAHYAKKARENEEKAKIHAAKGKHLNNKVCFCYTLWSYFQF